MTLLLLALAGLALLIPTAYAGWIGAPYAPTRLPVVKKAFDFIGVSPEDVVVDLGAGDGKIVLEAARRGAQAIGYELSPIMWLVASVRTLGKRNSHIRFGNFYTKSLRDATHVFAFLMPENMPKVRTYLARQTCPRGKFFLAYAFPFKDAEPLHFVRAKICAPIYIYDLQELTRRS